MAEFVTQINVGMNVDGVVTGTEKAKRSVRDLGDSARKVGESLGGMGDGTVQSAQKVEAATKSMVGSLQRQIAAVEAGDKSTRAYQESLARLRGVDVAVLKPYLDQLDAAKAKAEQATRATNDLTGSFDVLGSRASFAVSAIGLVGAAVSAAFSAASIKSVIDTADAFSKLEQKGGVGVKSLRELNYAASLSDVSTEALGTGLRKLSQNMAAAAGGGKDQAAAFAAVGVSIKGVDGALKGADQVFTELAGKFSEFKDGPEKAALAIELFGKQGADMIPLLNSGTSGLSEMAKEAGELGVVFGSGLAKNAEAFNDNLTRIQSSAEGAKIAIANELLPTLNFLAQAFLDAQKSSTGFGAFIGGAFRTTIESVAILFANVKFVFEGVGREIGAIAAQIVALGRLDFAGFTTISDAVKADAVRARAELEKFQFDLLNSGILTSKAGAGRGTGADPRSLGDTRTAAPVPPDAAAIAAAAAAAAAAHQKHMRELAERIKIGREIATQLGDFVIKENEAYQKALADATKENDKYVDSLTKSADAVAAQALKLQDEEQALRISAEQHITLAQAIAQVEIARLQERQAVELSYGDNRAAQAIQREIDARKELAAAIDKKEVREASRKAADTLAADTAKAAEKMKDSITDALMRGFENGKSLAENLRDTVVNMFKTMVLRPVVAGTVSMVASGAASAATSFAGSAAGNAIGSALGVQGLTAAGELQLSAGAMEALAGVQAALMGPVGIALLAGAAIWGSSRQGTATANTGDVRRNFDASGSLTRESTQFGITAAANDAVDSVRKAYVQTITALGATASASQFGYGSNNIDGGKVIVTADVGGKSYNSNEVRPDQLGLVASRAVLTALQGSDLPKYMSQVFNDLNVNEASQEAISAAIQYAGSLKALRESMLDIGDYTNILQAKVEDGFASLGTSAAKFKTDFVAALDGGLTKDQLATWQTLAADMNSLAEATGDYSLVVRSQTDILKERQGLQAQLDQLTQTSAQALQAQRDALDESNKSLFDQVQLAKSAKTASEDAAKAAKQAATDFAEAISGALSSIESARSRLTSAQANVDAIRAEATSNYLSALEEVSDAQGRLTTAQLNAQNEIARAANEAAREMGDLGRKLREFVDGATLSPSQSFAKLLTAALGGDRTAMQALPGAATGAIQGARQTAGSASDFAIQQARIIAQVSAVAGIAELAGSVLAPTTVEDPVVAAQRELTAAQTRLSEALTVANSIGAPLTAQITDLVGRYASAQSELTTAFNNLAAEIRQSLATIRVSAAGGTLAGGKTYTAAEIASAATGALQNGASAGQVFNDASTKFGISASDLASVASVAGITALTDYQKRIDQTATASQSDIAAAVAEATRRALAAGTTPQAEFVKHLQAIGWNAGMGDKYMGWSQGTTNAWAVANGFPAFARGVNYLPSDMLAQVHEGERIIPAADNRELMDRLRQPQQNGEALVDEIRSLREENRAQASAIVGLQSRMTKLFERWDGTGIPETRVTA